MEGAAAVGLTSYIILFFFHEVKAFFVIPSLLYTLL